MKPSLLERNGSSTTCFHYCLPLSHTDVGPPQRSVWILYLLRLEKRKVCSPPPEEDTNFWCWGTGVGWCSAEALLRGEYVWSCPPRVYAWSVMDICRYICGCAWVAFLIVNINVFSPFTGYLCVSTCTSKMRNSEAKVRRVKYPRRKDRRCFTSCYSIYFYNAQ